MNPKDPFVLVPDPILVEIFDYMGTRELTKLIRVSKRWHKFAKSDYLWKNNFRGTLLLRTAIKV
jgi:hypothetical protein